MIKKILSLLKQNDEILNTKIGKVSRSTLKHNPDMIRNEYQKLLNEVDHKNSTFYQDIRTAIYAASRKRYGEYSYHSHHAHHTETKKSHDVSRELIEIVNKSELLQEPHAAFLEYKEIKDEMNELGL